MPLQMFPKSIFKSAYTPTGSEYLMSK
uniref:Uncharacterized protein n=1 Tax=Anguilla anguilla TaxID=7936 RepID=A0A0E9TC95_ANGAN